LTENKQMAGLRTDLSLISEWIEPGSHILDLGCGDGTLLAYLQKHHQVTGYGLEIDDKKVAACIEKGVSVIQTDLNDSNKGLCDFCQNGFDYVVMTQTLQAMQRPDLLLMEMLRVGREGIVTFPNFGHLACRSQLFFKGTMPISNALPNPWYDTQNIRLCTLNDFENLCQAFGIKILQREVVDATHRNTFLMNLLPNLFGEIALYRFKKA